MRTLILTALSVLALTGAASAQTTTKKPTTPAVAKPSVVAAKPAAAAPATTAAKPAATTTGGVGRKPMTAASKACSAQADTKGLHGKDREKFRRACLKGS